jgi:predicted TIM-barrel fold metal-dependent hydrolase
VFSAAQNNVAIANGADLMSSVIDIHPHVISPDTKRFPLAPLGGQQSTWSRERPTPYEVLIKEMDEAGVDKAAIVHASTAYGYDNSYVAAAIAADRRRFTGVFSVDMFAPDVVAKIDYWIAQGFSGMRLFTSGSTMPGQAMWFADPKTYPAWEHAADHGIPICMMMTPQGIAPLRAIMEKFPKATIILDHLARAEFTDGPPFAAASEFFALARYDQVYLKVTPFNVSPESWGKATPKSFFGKLIETFGASRIAWGSNFPNSPGTLSEILGKAREAFSFATPDQQDWIFGKTAQILYPSLRD